MLRSIEGTFHPQTDGTAIIETSSGLGFLVSLASNSPVYKHFDGDLVKVFTLMTVREDDMSLYAFDSLDELDLFKLLISVNGVGAKMGLAIMSILPVGELKRTIAREDVKALTQANGVGKKLAQRIVLELKDKVGADLIGTGTDPDTGEIMTAPAGQSSERAEAIDALITLGYSRSEAQNAVGKIKEDGLTSEAYIKLALRNM